MAIEARLDKDTCKQDKLHKAEAFFEDVSGFRVHQLKGFAVKH